MPRNTLHTNGAAYIKIIVEHVPRMAKTVITQDVMTAIVEESHKRGLLVATHAVSVPTMQMAIDAGTDIHIHVPLEADMTPRMVEQIVKQKLWDIFSHKNPIFENLI